MPINICKHENGTTTIRGNWGPHTIKIVCADCEKWIKWGSDKTNEERASQRSLYRDWYIKDHTKK